MNKSTSSQSHNFSSHMWGQYTHAHAPFSLLRGKFYVVSCGTGKLGCLLQGGLHGCRTQSDRSCRGSRVSQAACINLNWHWTGNFGDVATWRISFLHKVVAYRFFGYSLVFLCVSSTSTLGRPSSKAVQTRQQTISGHLWCRCRHRCQSGGQPRSIFSRRYAGSW